MSFTALVIIRFVRGKKVGQGAMQISVLLKPH